MTAFAGSLTGRTREEQVFVANGINQWVTYRVRGGAILDGFFAPTTKTPFTDDLQLGYSVDLGRNMSFESTYNYRRTRDILEDYDAALYATTVERLDRLPRPDQRSELALPRAGLLRVRRQPRRQLHHRHARRRGTQLSRSRAEPAQALLGQLAGDLRATPTTTRWATPTPIRTRTSRATCSNSIRARRISTAVSRAASSTCSN